MHLAAKKYRSMIIKVGSIIGSAEIHITTRT
jgi:hypothetical protein